MKLSFHAMEIGSWKLEVSLRQAQDDSFEK